MGTSTYADEVKNVALVGDVEVIRDALLDWNGDEPLEINGWEYRDNCTAKLGKNGDLYADTLTKGRLLVYLINTSQYAAGGDFDFAVFAAKKADVQAFLKDFNLKGKIYSEKIICQTL